MPKSKFQYAGYERSSVHYYFARGLIYVIVIAGAAFMLAPFYWTITTSLSQNPTATAVIIMPHGFTLDNFATIFENWPVWHWFLSSIVVATGATFFNVTFDTLAGYSLAKLKWKFRDQIFLVFIATMMVPGMVLLIPIFIIIANLGLIDTYPGLIAAFIASPLGIFLLRQYFRGLPDSLGDAARLDGASEWTVFYRIYLPLAKPAVATLGIFVFVFTWNNFEWPLVIMQSLERYTLPVAIFAVQDEWTVDWELVMATAVILMTPLLVVFLMFQKHFIRGLTLGGMKGA